MIVFRVAGRRFPLNPKPPQRKKKPFTWEKPSAGIKPLTSKLQRALLYHLADQNGPKTFPMALHISI